MYELIRKGLFKLTPETAHHLTLDALSAASNLGLLRLTQTNYSNTPKRVMGIDFPNAVGLAAGLDKNGDYINALSELGFGFIEVGTITPRAQSGNPKPRLFRLPESKAIINRMGFNNNGVDYLVNQVIKAKYKGVLGINIGKNKNTPADNALDDYVYCLNKVYQHASYITVNLSSPNTPGLRDLQFGDPLLRLLEGIKKEQIKLSTAFGVYKPITVKIAPDMDVEDIDNVADALVQMEIDGVIATNTTISRDGVENQKHSLEAGGLSGQPVNEIANFTLERLSYALDGKLPIIGVGGIGSAEQAVEKINLGADLVQIYTGFIYEGPKLIRDSIEAIRNLK